MTVIVCPADALAGLSDAMVGGPPGETPAAVDVEAGGDVDGTVVDGTVVDGTVVDGVVVDVVRCFPLPVRVVVGVRAGGALMGAGLVAVRGGGEELPLNETINAIPAARTSAARAATAPMSHRLVEATGRASVSGSSRVSSRRGASPSGAPSRIRTSPPGRGGVGLADWSLASSRTMSVGGITPRQR